MVTSGVMIRSWKHKGLKAFFDSESKSGIQPAHAEKLKLILGALNAAVVETDMNFPGSGFHQLSGSLKGCCAVSVNGNWRVVFKFSGVDAYDVDYCDYH